MTLFERCVMLLLVLGLAYLVFSNRSLSRRLSALQKVVSTSSVEKKTDVNSNDVKSNDVKSENGLFSLFSSSSSASSSSDSNEGPSRTFLRGVFSFTETPKERYCYVDGQLFKVGMLTEYGICKVVSKNSVICVDGLHETVILPKVDGEGASGVSVQAVPLASTLRF